MIALRVMKREVALPIHGAAELGLWRFLGTSPPWWLDASSVPEIMSDSVASKINRPGSRSNIA